MTTETGIDGVRVVPLRRIPDERGTILHMLRVDDPHFVKFGEIYFTTVYEGVVKGWHKHREMTLNYACVVGRIKLVLYDDRDDSATRGALMEQAEDDVPQRMTERLHLGGLRQDDAVGELVVGRLGVVGHRSMI